MTNQEAFEKMVAHLRSQKSRCVAPGTKICMYKSGDKKCAVGALIPKKEYSEDLEGNDVEVLAEFVPSLKGLDLRMLGLMQSIHDTIDPDKWESRFNYIAKDFNLKMP